MYCDKCGEFFQPPPEEEKLITTGGVPALCTNCERARWAAKVVEKPLAPMFPGMGHIGDGRELYRAAWFAVDGTEKLFVAIPEKPRKPDHAPLRRERLHDIRVIILSERSSSNVTIPVVKLQTNITNYEKLRQKLWIRKVPGYWDAFTGTDAINVNPANIANIEQSDQRIQVNLKDGEKVVLYYR